ncbi:Uncharacterised protein [Vibrio cholerae]|nr:Uncharacterised protein [Vibrio cholerae]
MTLVQFLRAHISLKSVLKYSLLRYAYLCLHWQPQPQDQQPLINHVQTINALQFQGELVSLNLFCWFGVF